jgi:hypothetical protein
MSNADKDPLPPQDETKSSALESSIDLRLFELRQYFDVFVADVELDEEQIEWAWFIVREAYGIGYVDHRAGIMFPGFPFQSLDASAEVDEANMSFQEILLLYRRQRGTHPEE